MLGLKLNHVSKRGHWEFYLYDLGISWAILEYHWHAIASLDKDDKTFAKLDVISPTRYDKYLS